MNAFFSIIIPLYNKELFIEETLKSVFKQSFKDYEILVIDDGSTDASISKIKAFEDARIQIIHQKNQGAAAARNTGIALAKTDYIVFLDADDIWLPNHLEEFKKLLDDYPDCGLYCNRYKTKISNKKLLNTSFNYSFPDNYRGIIPDFFEASLVNRVAFTSAVMISKTILSVYGNFDTIISSGQDLDLWVRIAIHKPVAISNKTTAIYRFEIPNSLSKTSFLSKTIIDLDKFESYEAKNKSLKKFLDVYRLEYSLQYRIAGDKKKSNELLKKISSKPPFITRLLLKLPPNTLKSLLKIKHFLKRKGINFYIYH